MEIKRINTPNAPQPAGHYSQATVYNGLVFVAGQFSIDPATGEKKMGQSRNRPNKRSATFTQFSRLPAVTGTACSK